MGPRRFVLGLSIVVGLFVVGLLTLMTGHMLGVEAQPGIVNMSGIHEDQRIDMYDNVWIPDGLTLTLRNCTLVFHNEDNGARWLRGGVNSSLVVTDRDGDNATTGDASSISALGAPWGLIDEDMDRFVLTASSLENIGHEDLEFGYGLWITANIIRIEGASLTRLSSECRLESRGAVEIEGAHFSGRSCKLVIHADGRLDMDGCAFELLGKSLLGVTGSRCRVGNASLSGDAFMNLYGSTWISVADSVFRLRADLFVGGGAAEVLDCQFLAGAHLELDCDSAVVRGAFLEGIEGGYGGLQASSRLRVEGCAFRDLHQALSCDGDDEVDVIDCAFENVSNGITVYYSPDVRVLNTTLHGSDRGILLGGVGRDLIEDSTIEGFSVAVTISTAKIHRGDGLDEDTYAEHELVNLSISDCDEGVRLDAFNGPVSVEGASFSNVRGTALYMPYWGLASRETSVRGCSFTDVGVGINQSQAERVNTDDIDLAPFLNLTVEDCAFSARTRAIAAWGCRVVVDDCTFSGDPAAGGTRAGIFADYYANYRQLLSVHGCAFDACGPCIVPDGWNARSDSLVDLKDCTATNCTSVLSGELNCSLVCDGMTLVGCGVGLDVQGAPMVRASNLTISDGIDGLRFLKCHTVRLANISGARLSGWLVDEYRVDSAIWIVARPSTVSNVRASICGAIDVWSRLEVREALVQWASDYNYNSELVARPGARIELVNARLAAMSYGSYAINVWRGGSLDARDSSISGCRRSMNMPLCIGPYAEGATVRLINTTLTDCYRGFTVVDGNLTVDRCTVSSEEAGLFASGANVTVAWSSVLAGTKGLVVRASSLSVTDSTVDGGLCALDCQGSSLTISRSSLDARVDCVLIGTSAGLLNNASLSAGDRLLHMEWSDLELWTCQLQPRTFSEVLRESHATLYNTSWDGSWLLEGDTSFVRVLWSHEVVATYRWSGAPAAGEVVLVESTSGPSPPLNVTLGPDGRAGPFWLAEKVVVESGDGMLAPYNLTVESPGLFGRAVSACEFPTVVHLVVTDVSPPVVSIEGPASGSITNEMMVRFHGSVGEVGSGLFRLMYCVGGGDWVDMDPAAGPWSVWLTLGDGVSVLSVQALDRDRNNGLNYTSVIVDTVPPQVSFTSPSDGAFVREDRTVLWGRVLAGAGTPIAGVALGGVELRVGRATDFPIEVSLPDEGVSEFVLEAWDAAGNHAIAGVTVTRDTEPPDLEVDALPSLTNDPHLRVTGSCKDAGFPELKVGGVATRIEARGNFTCDLVLVEGPNLIEVVATDGAGNTARRTLAVELDTVVNATILRPRSGDVVHGELVTVVVQTEPHARTKVRDRTPWVVADGSGLAELNFTSGAARDLRIVVELQDAAGNEGTREVTFTVGGPEAFWTGGTVWAALVLLLVAVAATVTAVVLVQRRRRRAAD